MFMSAGANINAGCPALPVEGVGLDSIQAPNTTLAEFGD
jgi:hypothetical protein